MEKKFLDYYYEFMETETLSHMGLCNSLPSDLLNSPAWLYMRPTPYERAELFYQELPTVNWACGIITPSVHERLFGFTPLRQTVLLLAAALNGEFD